ncbi:MAG: DMT family transporter [Firmicutes bacterium]|nr:DMT family transporter [Bacillota bacterium]
MHKRYLADVALLAVTFVWGTTFVIVQDAIQVLPVFAFLALRFCIGGLILLTPVVSVPALRAQLRQRSLWLSGGFLGLWLFAGYALQTIGLLYTTPAKSGFITGLSVVLVPLFALLILKKRTSRAAWLGVAIATGGLFLLSQSKTGGINLGDVLTLLCAITFAVQIVYVGEYAPKYAALPLAAVQILTVGVLSILVTAFTRTPVGALQRELLTPTVLFALAITSLLATSVAYFAQMAFQKFTTPTRTALIFATEPVFAALASYLWTSDRLTMSAWVGCALILSGMLVAELGGAAHSDESVPS